MRGEPRRSGLSRVGSVLNSAALEKMLARVSRYEALSRQRFELWAEGLARYRGAVAAHPDPACCEEPWQKVRPILEEILTGDVLVRVWGGMLSAHDQVHGVVELEPLARRVLVGQIEASNQALGLLIQEFST